MYVQIKVSQCLSDGREIHLTEIDVPDTALNSAIKRINKAVEIFKKDEMPVDSKPETNFVHYNQTCIYCKAKNSVTVIEDSRFSNIQKEKLYCSKCQKTWPCTSRASSAATHDEKLLHLVQVIFRNARDKLYEDNLASQVSGLSEVETKIIERIIYG